MTNKQMSYRKIDILDLKIKFAHEVSYFKEYIVFNHKEQENWKKKVTRLLEEEIDEDKINEAILRMVYQYDLIKLPSYFYHSTIVALYSMFESTLMEICERTKKDLELQLSVNDFSTRDNLGKAVTYLEKLININFYKERKEWNQLNDFRSLRNIIVHQNSQFTSEPNTKEKELIKRLKYIQFDKSDFTFYVTDPRLINNFLDITCKLFDDIFLQIELKEVKLMEIIDRRPWQPDDCPF